MKRGRLYRTGFAAAILIVACFAPIELELTKEQRARIAESFRQDLHPAIVREIHVRQEKHESQVIDRTGTRRRIHVVRDLSSPSLDP